MGDWRKTTAKVLNHLRSVFNEEALKNATEQEQAAVKGVWAFIRVKMLEYWEDVDGLWGKIKPNRRRGVRQQLLTRFPEEAFLDNERGKAARDEFTRADLLAWGEQLLNPADAAANAVSDANAATSAEGVQGDPRAEADVQKPEGGEAADAAANVADGAAVADRVAVETTNAAVADANAAAAFNPTPQERGPPAGEPTASEGVDGELPLCLNDVSSQTANSYNQMTIKTHGHVVYDTINLQDLTDFACMKKKKRSEVRQICASVYFLQDLLTIYPHGRGDTLDEISSTDYDRILKQIKERTERIVANAMEIEYQSFDALRVDSCDEDEPPTDGAPLEEPKGAVAVDAAFVLDERGADDAPSAMETDPTLPNFELPTTTNVDLQEIINNPVRYNNSSRLQKLLRLSGRDRHTADEIRRILPELRRYTAQTQNHELQHLISKFEASASTGSSFFSRILNSISSSVSSFFSSSAISSTESLSKEAPAKKKQLVRQARFDQGLSVETISGIPNPWERQIIAEIEEGQKMNREDPFVIIRGDERTRQIISRRTLETSLLAKTVQLTSRSIIGTCPI